MVTGNYEIHKSTGLEIGLPFLDKRGCLKGAKIYSKYGIYKGIVKSICYNTYYAGNIMIELDTGLHQSVQSIFITDKELKRMIHIRIIRFIKHWYKKAKF